MKEIICIVCPRGCHLTVDPDRDYDVRGQQCERGLVYGREEARNPRRLVTSTVRLQSRRHPRLPVKTDRPVPKDRVAAVVLALDDLVVSAPVRRGDVLLDDVAGSGAAIVATRSILE